MDHEDSTIETAFHQLLTKQYGEAWPNELPEDVLSLAMPMFFAGTAVGMKIGREGGAVYAKAVVEVEKDLNYRFVGHPLHAGRVT